MQTQIIHPLQRLTDQAATIAQTQQMLTICNACRYCEGFCAVFPAMTRRLDFTTQDVHYLANLCHNCGACLHSCQYAPPHEFAVNIPQAMAKVRLNTYQTYAWPAAFGRAYEHNGLVTAFILFLISTLALIYAVWMNGGLLRQGLAGNFYAVFPHNTLVFMFGGVFGFSVLAIGVGIKRFWGEIKHLTLPKPDLNVHDAIQAVGNIATLKYLDGGHGQGCNESDDRFTHARRHFHHATMYGFLLCFASTGVATLYHYLGNLQAPYAYTSLPVILGTLGGLGLIIGPIGLWVLNRRRHPMHGDPSQKPMDIAFILLLLWISITGLVLLFARDTHAMPLLLAIHLGCVMALFITLPYSKFVHGFYRGAALLKWAIEQRSPSQLKLGDD